jgi:hypothetical protein
MFEHCVLFFDLKLKGKRGVGTGCLHNEDRIRTHSQVCRWDTESR